MYFKKRGNSKYFSKSKCQASVEYLMIVTFVLAILVPTSAIAFNSYNNQRDIIAVKQAEKAVNSIVQAAESVYYLGAPSKTTIEVFVPENVFEVNVESFEINMRVKTKRGIEDVVSVSRVNLTGSVPKTKGSHYIQVLATGEQVDISK